jgi:hypothetical protein
MVKQSAKKNHEARTKTYLKILTNLVRAQTRDRVEKSTIAAKHLKFFAGNTQNINESKINLDS